MTDDELIRLEALLRAAYAPPRDAAILATECAERAASELDAAMTDDAIRAVLTAEVRRVEDLVSSWIGKPGHGGDDAWDGWNKGAMCMMQWIAKGEVIR